mmetsp:Transcript_14970/g.47631  ORF Transcript_14970/g.47631 Transcript_14970/m.47631 type:complete len:263 (+) Transcript_14970:523-1311(+)
MVVAGAASSPTAQSRLAAPPGFARHTAALVATQPPRLPRRPPIQYRMRRWTSPWRQPWLQHRLDSRNCLLLLRRRARQLRSLLSEGPSFRVLAHTPFHQNPVSTHDGATRFSSCLMPLRRWPWSPSSTPSLCTHSGPTGCLGANALGSFSPSFSWLSSLSALALLHLACSFLLSRLSSSSFFPALFFINPLRANHNYREGLPAIYSTLCGALMELRACGKRPTLRSPLSMDRAKFTVLFFVLFTNQDDATIFSLFSSVCVCA